MTYHCPRCHGEAPELDGGECPWCGLAADGSFDGPEPIERVAKLQDKADEDYPGALGRLFS